MSRGARDLRPEPEGPVALATLWFFAVSILTSSAGDYPSSADGQVAVVDLSAGRQSSPASPSSPGETPGLFMPERVSGQALSRRAITQTRRDRKSTRLNSSH